MTFGLAYIAGTLLGLLGGFIAGFVLECVVTFPGKGE